MKYTVCWKPLAEDQLAEIWLEASDRTVVTNASDEIERLLAIDPERLGQSRGGQKRVLVLPPIAVSYEVSPAEKTGDRPGPSSSPEAQAVVRATAFPN